MSECRDVAEDFIEELLAKRRCEKAEVSGSLRRGEPYTHDVDIVCADPAKNPRSSMDNPEPNSKISIEKTTRNGCALEVYSANVKHYGALLFSTTEPAGAAIGVRRKASEKGYKLNHYGLWKNDELVASETEDEICMLVHERPCKAPEERGK